MSHAGALARVEAALASATRVEAQLHAFLSLDPAGARRRAAELDA